MAKTWVIADTHFGHKNIIEYGDRPFRNVDEMENELIRRWNSVVKPEDTVYHLGDVLFGGKKVRERVLPQLNGYKILRLGNHDNRTTKAQWRKHFDEVYEDDILLDELCLSHYPVPEEDLDKMMHIDLVKGNVHGHKHQNIEGLDQTKYRSVSVELTAYMPVDFDSIKEQFGVK